MDFQTRCDLAFDNKPSRREVFRLVNGRRTAREISVETGRPENSIRNDLRALRNLELIEEAKNKDGSLKRIGKCQVYSKTNLAKEIKLSNYRSSKTLAAVKEMPGKGREKPKKRKKVANILEIPSAEKIRMICSAGEDQIYEFKESSEELKKIVKDICAFANTKKGGLVFYGVADNGEIKGVKESRQRFEERLRPSVNNLIAPAMIVKILQVRMSDKEVLIIRVSPWGRTEVFHYNGRVYIRDGPISRPTEPEESRKLHRGEYVI